MEYVNLDAYGFRSDMYDTNSESCKDANNMACYEAGVRTSNLDQLPSITGNFGLSPNGISPRCQTYSYDLGMQQQQNPMWKNQQQGTEMNQKKFYQNNNRSNVPPSAGILPQQQQMAPSNGNQPISNGGPNGVGNERLIILHL
jgi:hypothetical protein